jgi:hypothetical protein
VSRFGRRLYWPSQSRNFPPFMKDNDVILFISNDVTAPSGPGFTMSLRHTAIVRTPLDVWSVRRTDLYLTTHNTHKKQKPMPSVGFETTIPARERPQTHALDRAATGNDVLLLSHKPAQNLYYEPNHVYVTSEHMSVFMGMCNCAWQTGNLRRAVLSTYILTNKRNTRINC